MRLSIVNILANGAHHGIILIHYPDAISTDHGMIGKLRTKSEEKPQKNPEEIQKILNHLRKNKSPPFDNET